MEENKKTEVYETTFSDLTKGDYFYAVMFNKVFSFKIENDCKWSDQNDNTPCNYILYHVENNPLNELKVLKISNEIFNKNMSNNFVRIFNKNGNWPCKIFSNKCAAEEYKKSHEKNILLNDNVISVGDLLPLHDKDNHTIIYEEVYDVELKIEDEYHRSENGDKIKVVVDNVYVTVINKFGRLQKFVINMEDLNSNNPFKMIDKNYDFEDLKYELFYDNKTAVKYCLQELDADMYNLASKKAIIYSYLNGVKGNIF